VCPRQGFADWLKTIPMPEKTIKSRLQDCDAALASDDGPIFATVAKRWSRR
jgi:hypothetical protein